MCLRAESSADAYRQGRPLKYRILQTYVKQVREQCQFIIMAHAGIRAAVDLGSRACQERRQGDVDLGLRMGEDAYRELWYSAQAMMSAVANVHKLAWGLGKGASAQAREPIRRALEIDRSSAISKDARDMRHNFDHYEDRIREWAESGEGLKIEGVGGPLSINGHTCRTQWRNYDPVTGTLWFWGKSIDLGAIEREARRLIPITEDITRLCPECMEKGREHIVRFPVPRVYPAGQTDSPGSAAEGNST
jgi:hypothetical protein